MSIKNIIRAWKDEDYRLSLSEAERRPAGAPGGAHRTVGRRDGRRRRRARLLLPLLLLHLSGGEEVIQPCRGHRPPTLTYLPGGASSLG